MRMARRARKAARILSLRLASVAISRLNASRGTASTSPGSATRADTNTRWPVRRFSSPRNRPAGWRAMTRSFPSELTTISTAPARTT